MIPLDRSVIGAIPCVALVESDTKLKFQFSIRRPAEETRDKPATSRAGASRGGKLQQDEDSSDNGGRLPGGLCLFGANLKLNSKVKSCFAC